MKIVYGKTGFFIASLVFCAGYSHSGGPSLETAGSTPTVIQLPKTPAGEKARALLDAINSCDAKAFHRFFDANLVPSGWRVCLDAFDSQHRFDAVKIESATDDDITLLAYAPVTEDWLTIHLKIDPASQLLTEVDVRTKIVFASCMLTDVEMIKTIETSLDKLVQADAFSGVVLIAKNGIPIFQKAYGIANKACNMPNNSDTKFNLGSINKMFTAIAIGQLAEQGKLSFDDTVGKLLPDYPNKTVAQKVTVAHLLSHTSGLGGFFNETWENASKLRFLKIADYFSLFVDKPLVFEPGARWRYSNAGFIVLGAIVEKVSGQDYFEYVREHIYKPAGMSNTDAFELDFDTPNLAVGYTYENRPQDDKAGSRAARGPRRNNLFLHGVKGGPAGGGYSTAPDLLRFAVALQNNKLLSAEMTKVITTAKPQSFAPDNRYAYGFADHIINGCRVFGHNGGFAGINAILDIYPDLGYVVVVMANYDPPAAERVAKKISGLIIRT
jgi:CubicO group peptidase (beta-lactamase class C family)